NLSKMYRVALLAKSLKLSIGQLLILKALTGLNPFDVAHTEDTLRFVQVVETVRASAFSITDLDYLLPHQFTEASRIAPADDGIALILDGIRYGLQKIAAENMFSPDLLPDLNGELTKRKLATLPDLGSGDVDKAMSLLDGTWTDVAAKRDFIDTHFAKFLDATDTKAKLVGPPPALATKELRFAYVLEPLLAYLRRTLSEN